MNMKIEPFKDWLRRQGAEILAPTNAYEVLRFRAKGAVHVVYTGRRGLSIPEFVKDCYRAFEKNLKWDMGITATPRTQATQRKVALLARDGRECFYCGHNMPNEDMTVEHLIPLDKRGPDHEGNMALAHAACNRKAANLPLTKKIQLRDKMREVIIKV